MTSNPPTDQPARPQSAVDVLRDRSRKPGRGATRIIPWVISLTGHAAMVVLGLLIPWTTLILARDTAPPAVIAEFNDARLVPLQTVNTTHVQTKPNEFEDRSRLESPADTDLLEPSSQLSDLASTLGPSITGDALRGFVPRTGTGDVMFGGLTGSNARYIVYVVDASGSMVAYLPIIIDELVRSIDRLSDAQQFRIVFFQKNEAVLVPGPGEKPKIATDQRRGKIDLLRATNENKLFAFDWIDLDRRNIRATSQSNPIAAIRLALKDMRPRPDVIFLLSTDITGMGEYEIDQRDLLRMISGLNRNSSGKIKTVIKTIQFIFEDPLETLKHIADENGGPEGYRFLSREDLGLDR